MHRCALFDLPCRVTSLDCVALPRPCWRSVLKPVHLCGTVNDCGYSRQPLKCSPKASSSACLRPSASDLYGTVHAGALSCRQVKCLPAPLHSISSPSVQTNVGRPWRTSWHPNQQNGSPVGEPPRGNQRLTTEVDPIACFRGLWEAESRLVRPSCSPTSILSFAPATAYGWSRHAFPRLADLASYDNACV